MKIPLNFWLYSMLLTVGVSTWYFGLLTNRSDPNAAWWLILEFGSMVIYKLIKDRWYSPADELAADSSSALTIFEGKDVKASLKIVRVGFILSAALWVLVALKYNSFFPLIAAMGCLLIALFAKWWVVRFATWFDFDVKSTAFGTIAFSLLLVTSFPLW